MNPDLFAPFDRLFCINLKRNPSRWCDFHEAFRAAGLPVDRIERFDAIDGRLTPAPAWWRAGPGAWGCLQSHRFVLERALRENARTVLIFEDDAVPCHDASQKLAAFWLALPRSWHSLLLGGQHLKPPTLHNDSVLRVTNGNRTHAYALRHPFIAVALRHLSDLESHQSYPTYHVDHRMGQLHETGRYRVFAPREWLFGQRPGRSDVSTRQVGERFWSTAAIPPASRLVHTNTPAIFVLGTYRSGTSCVAGTLHQLGCHLGSDLAAGNSYNPSGYFESQLLSQLLRKAADEPALRHRIPPEYVVRGILSWFRREQETTRCDHTPITMKHPLLCLYAQAIADIWPTPAKYLVVRRNAKATATSLKRTGWWPQNTARRLQKALDQALSQFTESVPHLVVHYESLLNHPLKEIDRMCSWLSLSPPAAARRSAGAFIHHPGSKLSASAEKGIA